MTNSSDWNQWFLKQHPKLDGLDAGLVLILARKIGEPKIDPVGGIQANDWIKAIAQATTHNSHASKTPRDKTSGLLDVRELPFSEQSFKDIAKNFYIHDSVEQVVSRADVSHFSAVKLDMGRQNCRRLPAQVYNARTSNAWQVMFGCTLSIEAEILTRLATATYEVCHPLLVTSMLIEIERTRHMPIVNNTVDELEGRILVLDEDPEFLQHITETEKVTRKKERRLAWLDMQYLRNQLLSWSTCLEAFDDHAEYLNQTIFRDISSSNPDTDWYDSIDEVSPVHGKDNEEVSHHADAVSTELQVDKHQEMSSVRLGKCYMRRTGTKMRWRLREIMKEYNEKIRECTEKAPLSTDTGMVIINE
ncbi:hypothetical protein FMUND_9550 [Fusarium mundagurra]|uniref:Uncharacterized protein n=1 Tax=Fusarium mundagurra TaxID=1567541 RepID=A0A8H5YD31_9HYPO|nr:hypothetical protein FMUND_9550 [Fusarium mundagurra]